MNIQLPRIQPEQVLAIPPVVGPVLDQKAVRLRRRVRIDVFSADRSELLEDLPDRGYVLGSRGAMSMRASRSMAPRTSALSRLLMGGPYPPVSSRHRAAKPSHASHAILNAMSEAEDLVYEFTDAYNARDVDHTCALCTEDVEVWTFLEGRIGETPFRGHAGIRGWHRSETEAWEELRVADPRARDLGEGVVLGLATVRGRGRGSGVELEAAGGWIFEVREGRIARLRAFDSAAKAREAAGLMG